MRMLARRPYHGHIRVVISYCGATLLEFLDRQQKRTTDPRELWTALARVILNLDEAITKE